MKIKQLIILRHGEPLEDDRDFLTPESEKKIEVVGTFIRERFPISKENLLILPSSEMRAIRTAYRLLDGIGFSPLEIDFNRGGHKALFSDADTCDPEAALALIEKFKAKFEICIIITHGEMTAELPKLLSEKFGIHSFVNQARYGEGYVFDFVKKTADPLTRRTLAR